MFIGAVQSSNFGPLLKADACR